MVANTHTYLAKGGEIGFVETGLGGGDVPETVQMFPPGEQVAYPTNAEGEMCELKLVVDAELAERLEAVRAEYQAAADAGQGDAPFFDFNHEDREASAWPKRIFWAGDDAQTGGVRAEVEWSAAGKSAVVGKLYRRFSPAFYTDKTAAICGAPVNMGGLVNRAGFTRIQALFAKQFSAAAAVVEANLKQPMETTNTDDLEAKLREANARIQELEAQVEEMRTKEAEDAVEMAARDGRIPPQCKETRDTWVATIKANPSAKSLLFAMAAHPAVAGVGVVAGKQVSGGESPAALLQEFHAKQGAERDVFFAQHAAALKAARDGNLN